MDGERIFTDEQEEWLRYTAERFDMTTSEVLRMILDGHIRSQDGSTESDLSQQMQALSRRRSYSYSDRELNEWIAQHYPEIRRLAAVKLAHYKLTRAEVAATPDIVLLVIRQMGEKSLSEVRAAIPYDPPTPSS